MSRVRWSSLSAFSGIFPVSLDDASSLHGRMRSRVESGIFCGV